MGLDDFASADELEAIQASAPAPVFDQQDEDLFDFPDMTLRTAKPPIGAEPAPAAEAAPVKDISTEAAPVEAPTGATTPEPAAPLPNGQAYDPVLDEDIFSFDEIFTPAESQAGNDMIPATDLFQPSTEGADPFAGEPEQEQATVAPAPSPAVAPAQASAPPRERKPRVQRTRQELAPIVIADETEGNPLKSRLVLYFAIGFALANATVVFFAWRASHSFETAMDSVRDELKRPPVVAMPAPTTEESDEGADQPSPDPRSIEEAELLLAQKELDEGHFGAARMRLYQLLANRDRIAVGAEEVAFAEFMIARTYLLEGEAAIASNLDPETTR